MTKVCFKCGKEKDIDLFYKHKKMSDGHLNKCIECAKKDSIKHRKDNLEKVKEYDRNRKNKKERTEQLKKHFRKLKEIDKDAYNKKRAEINRRYKERDKAKERARANLFYAVSTGKIKNPCKCERCGKEGYTEAHHEDYSKPLDINWLCDSCHKKRHIEIRSEKRKLLKELLHG
jgi:hypothetical protein